jgi:hypothetical protein
LLVVPRRHARALPPGDVAAAGGLARDLSGARIDGVAAVTTSPSGLSDDRAVQIATVRFDAPVFDESITSAVDHLRDRADELTAGGPLSADLTGEAATTRDASSPRGKARSSASVALLDSYLAGRASAGLSSITLETGKNAPAAIAYPTAIRAAQAAITARGCRTTPRPTAAKAR